MDTKSFSYGLVLTFNGYNEFLLRISSDISWIQRVSLTDKFGHLMDTKSFSNGLVRTFHRYKEFLLRSSDDVFLE